MAAFHWEVESGSGFLWVCHAWCRWWTWIMIVYNTVFHSVRDRWGLVGNRGDGGVNCNYLNTDLTLLISLPFSFTLNFTKNLKINRNQRRRRSFCHICSHFVLSLVHSFTHMSWKLHLPGTSHVIMYQAKLLK